MPKCPSSPTRRTVLTAAAATAALPVLDAALGTISPAAAAATRAGAAATQTGTAATTKSGWLATPLKAAELKDRQFTAVGGQDIVLARSGKTVRALSSACTHKGCIITPTAGSEILGPCPCHQATFNLDGSAAKAPATTPLPHYAIRVNDKGFLEIDPGQKLPKDDKNASVTIS
jgi:Rieske Fe-S protein